MPKLSIKALCLALALTLTLAASPALAAEAMQQLKGSIDSLIVVLGDADLGKPENVLKRREALREIIYETFDFRMMARRSLGRHWKVRTEQERTDFTKLYTKLMERTYLRRIEKYGDEEVHYLSEKSDDKYAVIKTKVLTGPDIAIPITYKLYAKGDKWEVYDVLIEGVSLIKNFRTQFNQIIRSKSYEALIKRLQKKIAKPMSEK